MISIRLLTIKDYENYLSLLRQLSPQRKSISREDFSDYLQETKNVFIYVIEIENKIVGAGSLFLLPKIHGPPVAQIEDVVIDKDERGKGYGKMIVEYLREKGLEMGYKVILNCSDDNLQFYEKCGFIKSGNQCRNK